MLKKEKQKHVSTDKYVSTGNISTCYILDNN